MMEPTLTSDLIGLVYDEARYLDEQRWQDWLALFDPAATYWVPAWKDEHQPTGDPATEISLIYASDRRYLEERVKRATGTKSMASQPLPRTLHCISNARAEPAEAPDTWRVRSNCVTHVYDLRTEALRFLACRYEHTIAMRGGTLAITRKKALLINDKVQTVLDFYCV